MKLSLSTIPVVALFILSLAAAMWTMSPASANMGETISQSWNQFLYNVNAGASDHAKLKDCVTDGEAK